MAEGGDTAWDTMVAIGTAQQQNWYEMLPDEWTIYEECDHQYLKLKIAMAIFGLPEEDSNDVTEWNSTDDLIQCFKYNHVQRELIDTVFEQICTHGKGYLGFPSSICYNLVYNVYFRPKMEIPTENGNKDDKEKNETKENKVTDTIKVNTTPIFKIQKSIKKIVEKQCEKPNGKPDKVQKEIDVTEIWFIDIFGRVYKSWESYKSDNILPACTMVLPQDGLYQPNLACLFTEQISTVWLEIVDSPACSFSKVIYDVADTGSTIASAVGMGIGIASMFTPIGPAVAGVGLATTTLSGLWTAGRSAQHLIDRSTHEESISITERKALGAWIGIAGSVFGVASSAGTTLITKSAQAGQNISNAAKIASNTAIGGSLFFNGAGLLFQGFSMYTKYRDENTIDPADALFFVAHVFFFSSAVMNVKFAGSLIESTQGKVIDDFQANIRSKRMRKAFNRATNRAESTAEVVRFVNTKKDILANMKPSTNASTSTSANASTSTSTSANAQTIHLKFENGRIRINNEYLLDPMQFVRDVTIQNGSYRASMGRSTDASGNVDSTVYSCEVFISLKNQLQAYVESLCGGVSNAMSSKIVEEATDVLKDMLGVHEPEDMLCLVIQIAVQLLTTSAAPKQFLPAALHFVLAYVKAHLKRREANSTSTDSARMYKVLYTIVEHCEKLMPLFEQAFKFYMGNRYQ